MNNKLLHRIFAAGIFIIALLQFWSTVQPSVSFWDCGEFIASSFYLQVPHPPGAPFFLILGNIFSKIPIVENFGMRVNLISVFSSAFAVLFLFLSAVKLIENYKGKRPESLKEAFYTYTAAGIGALAFSFSDTFWFNGVEAEVYAFSMLLVSSITYLILRWHENPDSPDSEKYILMIAYLVGISTGVHLMSVLAAVPVVMIIWFRKYVDDEEMLKSSGYLFLMHGAIILLIALIWWAGETSKTPPTQEQYQAYDARFKIILFVLSIAIMGIFWKKVFNKNSFYVPVIIGGVALFFTYPGVVKYLPKLMSAVAGDDFTMQIIFLLVLFGILLYGMYYATQKNKPALHLVFTSVLFIIIGFTTFAMVIIRANLDPPMNENSPKTFSALEKYLNREQYGDFPTFKRRFATEPHQMVTYNNYASDLDFFYRYQMNHMMTRYLLWNFAGREGWRQDDGVDIAPFNGIGNALSTILGGVSFGGDIKDSLFGIPLLLGLFGIYFQFKKDWKMASIFMVMFILMGYLTAFYQNQQQPQPRERDYFYVGAFFVYGIWIAIGMRGLVDLVSERVKEGSSKQIAIAAVLLLGVIFVPVRMVQANYFTHDRSKNWVPWDYSYNILQSCAPNAVLFTNGDNDTFPLWYLQDVEGVRRDVKIVNLSLLNTDWYIKQLKDSDPYNVGTVRIRMSDSQIENVRPIKWNPTKITIPTPKPRNRSQYSEIVKTYDIEDTTSLAKGSISWTMPNTLNFGDVKAIRVQDIMVREIVEANNWVRPIYFAVTCADNSKIGLNDYLKMEGMAFRLVPEKRKAGEEFINQKVMAAELVENPGYSKTYKPGFKFRGLNNPDIFFDDNHKRMVQNYRNSYIRLAISYMGEGKKDLTIKTLNRMNEKLPYKLLGIDNGLLFEIANLYLRAGDKASYKKLAADIEKTALAQLNNNPGDVQSYYNPYRILLETYENLEEYNKAAGIWERLKKLFPNDPAVDAGIKKFRTLAAQKDSLKNK